MRAGETQRRVVMALKHHAPLDDAQIAYLVRQMGGTASSAAAARRRLVARGQVRFAGLVRRNKRGQLVSLWELVL